MTLVTTTERDREEGSRNKPVVILARSFSLPSFFFFLPPKMPSVTMPSGACGAYTCCGRIAGRAASVRPFADGAALGTLEGPVDGDTGTAPPPPLYPLPLPGGGGGGSVMEMAVVLTPFRGGEYLERSTDSGARLGPFYK